MTNSIKYSIIWVVFKNGLNVSGERRDIYARHQQVDTEDETTAKWNKVSRIGKSFRTQWIQNETKETEHLIEISLMKKGML